MNDLKILGIATPVCALARNDRVFSNSPHSFEPSGKSVKKRGLQTQAAFFGDPYGNRTHVTAVKGRCLNRLTNGPGSGNLIRTDDIPGMNRLLYQLSYAAMWSMQFRHRRNSFCIISEEAHFVKPQFVFF